MLRLSEGDLKGLDYVANYCEELLNKFNVPDYNFNLIKGDWPLDTIFDFVDTANDYNLTNTMLAFSEKYSISCGDFEVYNNHTDSKISLQLPNMASAIDLAELSVDELLKLKQEYESLKVE